MAMTGDSRERTGSEEALRELRERYALATAAGGVGVWDRDLATTARKQAEAALREAHEFRERILESAVTAIVAFDREGRFTLVNGRVSELTGYAADELLGRTPDFLLPPEQRDAVMQALATA